MRSRICSTTVLYDLTMCSTRTVIFRRTRLGIGLAAGGAACFWLLGAGGGWLTAGRVAQGVGKVGTDMTREVIMAVPTPSRSLQRDHVRVVIITDRPCHRPPCGPGAIAGR